MQICWKVHFKKKNYRTTKLPKWLYWKIVNPCISKGADLQQQGSYIQNFKPFLSSHCEKKGPTKKMCLVIQSDLFGMVKWPF